MKFEFSDKAAFQEYFGPAHQMVRRSVKEFVDKEIVPHINDWEEMNEFPLDLYKKAGNVGILGIGYPEEYGGTPGDIFFQIAAWEEIMRCGSGGVAAGLGSLNIAIPPISWGG
jgi:acyl-CoA dehydrogenase